MLQALIFQILTLKSNKIEIIADFLLENDKKL